MWHYPTPPQQSNGQIITCFFITENTLALTQWNASHPVDANSHMLSTKHGVSFQSFPHMAENIVQGTHGKPHGRTSAWCREQHNHCWLTHGTTQHNVGWHREHNTLLADTWNNTTQCWLTHGPTQHNVDWHREQHTLLSDTENDTLLSDIENNTLLSDTENNTHCCLIQRTTHPSNTHWYLKQETTHTAVWYREQHIAVWYREQHTLLSDTENNTHCCLIQRTTHPSNTHWYLKQETTHTAVSHREQQCLNIVWHGEQQGLTTQ